MFLLPKKNSLLCKKEKRGAREYARTTYNCMVHVPWIGLTKDRKQVMILAGVKKIKSCPESFTNADGIW